MKYIEEFRNGDAARVLIERIALLAGEIPGTARIMEVCGTHTVAIARAGIRSVLPKNVDLISGPGCPVCVTDTGYIDAAIELAKRNIVIATFGDMVKVPGSRQTLSAARASGAVVHTCYSPLEAVKLAKERPQKEIVFLGVGFETTIGPVVSLVEQSFNEGIKNLSLLTAFKTVPEALHTLASDPDVQISAFLCPAHVSAIIGSRAYEPIADRHRLPCVIAGFEPLDILLGLTGILEQLKRGEAKVENQYRRVVRPDGNRKAQALMALYLEPADVPWRGLGIIPGSGLKLRPEFKAFDAENRFGITVSAGTPPAGCRCGEVLKGILKPTQCRLFGKACTPDHPIGPCMVSSEGSCAAYFRYQEAP